MSGKFPKQGCGSETCPSCHSLAGNGPWCLRCGMNMDKTSLDWPGRYEPDSGFTFDVCDTCREEMDTQ